MRPELQETASFLKLWEPEGLWVLVSIGADKKREITTATFKSSQEGEALDWVREQNEAKQRNIYFTVNPVRESVSKKPRREDIASLSWLHVDVDPRVGEDLASEQERIRRLLLEELPEGMPTPTFVVFSGGGYQAFWRLEDPFPIGGDPARYEEAKRWNMQLELVFGADSCHNVDRIMRLPGTVNWPDERKKRKGRKPALAKLVLSRSELTYPLGQFTPAALVQAPDDKGFSAATQTVEVSGNVKRLGDVNELGPGVNDYCKVIIVQGLDPDEPNKLGSRSEWLWFVVCELVRSGVDDETIYSVITDPGFKISGHVLDQDDPEKSAKRHIERAKEHAVHPKLRELNEQHAVVGDVGGKCRIISEVIDPSMRRTRISFQTAADFRLRYCNQQIEFATGNGKTTSVKLGEWWLHHPKRRQFDTIVFAPESDTPGAYNLWKGFACQSRPGDCSLFLDHVRENICGGNGDYYRYLFGWMASAVQDPASPGHTAVVLRGKMGTGKSFFAKAFGHLFGRHFLQVSDPKHLVGSFNAHLRDCVVLFGDEAFYAGDKKHESVLKTLVTEEMITIEAKGVDAQAAPNCTHIILASNSDWVVPAGQDERRFFVLDVSDDHMQDSSYFRKILHELENGGYEALLHHLRTADLSGFNVRALPKTKALQQQKVLSYDPQRDWWYQKLLNGEILEGCGWTDYVYATQLRDDYVEHARSFNLTQRGNSTRLGHFLKKCFPTEWEARGQLRGTHKISYNGKTTEQSRPRVYRIPNLETCRKTWDENFGGPFDWPQIADLDEENELEGKKVPF